MTSQTLTHALNDKPILFYTASHHPVLIPILLVVLSCTCWTFTCFPLPWGATKPCLVTPLGCCCRFNEVSQLRSAKALISAMHYGWGSQINICHVHCPSGNKSQLCLPFLGFLPLLESMKEFWFGMCDSEVRFRTRKSFDQVIRQRKGLGNFV